MALRFGHPLPALVRSPARGDAAALGGLAMVVVALFHDVLLRGRVLYERDIHIVWTGLAETFVRCVRSASWPVWDPYQSFGRPLLANPATQVLYPWTWLNLLAPPHVTYAVYATTHVLLSGIGLFALARRLGLSRPAAFTGAAVWMGSGPFLSTVNLWNHLAGAAWMPWVVLAADGALRAPSARRVLLWGAAFATQILAGSPEACLMTVGVVVVHAASLLRGPEPPATPGRALRAGALALAFALGLCAVLWMPALEAVRHSSRWDLSEATRAVWSVHPAALLQVIAPVLPRDLPLSPTARTALFETHNPLLSSLYVGLPAVVLVGAAFLAPRPPWPFGVIVLFASLLALGRHTWVFAAAVHALPPLRLLRYPSKAMVAAAFGGALLCSYGYDAWGGRQEVARRRLLVLVVLPAVAGAAIVASILWLAAHPDGWSRGLLEARPGLTLGQELSQVRCGLAVAGALAAVTAGLAVARLRQEGIRTAPAMAALSIVALLSAHHALNPTAPADLYLARPKVLDVLRADAASRLYVFDYVGRVTGKLYRRHMDEQTFTAASPLEAARGLQAYLLPQTGSRWGFFGSYDNDLYSLFPPQLKSLGLIFRAAEETPTYMRLLRLGSVDHVVALHQEGLEGLQPLAVLPSPFREGIRVFRVPAPLPRSYAVAGARVADGLPAYRTLTDPSFDPAGEVVLPEGTGDGAAGPAGTTRIVELRGDRVRIAADLERSGYVVLVDTYDPGWKASVDGRGTPVLRANAAFRAVRVGPGRHLVEMVYRPSSIIVGAAISTAAVLTGLFAAARRPRRS